MAKEKSIIQELGGFMENGKTIEVDETFYDDFGKDPNEIYRYEYKHRDFNVKKITLSTLFIMLVGGSGMILFPKVSKSYNKTIYCEKNNTSISIDNLNYKGETEEKIKNMFNEMYSFANDHEINDLTSFYENHYLELNSTDSEAFGDYDIAYMYASNAYKKAHDNGISDKDIANDLNNMFNVYEEPTCLNEGIEKAVIKLDKTIDLQNESLYTTYGPLSIIMHNEICDKEHIINEYGTYGHSNELSKQKRLLK